MTERGKPKTRTAVGKDLQLSITVLSPAQKTYLEGLTQERQQSFDNLTPKMYSGLWRWKIFLSCGCTPLFYYPAPKKGEYLGCRNHGAVAVTGRESASHYPKG